jgi:hypothetical protein
MSQESTTPDLALLVQRRVDAVNARDIDAAMGFYAPDAVYDTSPMGLGRFEGRVFLWVDGLIERVTAYLDIEEARAAAERLAEERAQADV